MQPWTTKQIPDLTGQLAVVTGANSGIGWHTALELARAGARVILAARSEEKGAQAVRQIQTEVARADVQARLLDLADLASVRAFAASVLTEPRLDLLLNNAGVMAVPERRETKDGFELQFGTNFLGPFALTGLLLPALLRAPHPRVTTVSSGAANMGKKRIDFDDLQSLRVYGPWKAYCQSKLADLLFALELGRRARAARLPLLSTAAHPGYARTNLQTSGPGRPQHAIEKLFARFASHDAAQGALPTLRAAVTADSASGDYFAPSRLFQLKGPPVQIPLPRPACNEAAAAQLWQVSEQLTGVRFAFERA
jgi:NAD(P)-dependent dehydrogenase (short-subunit alcohol dehydrogenase family)